MKLDRAIRFKVDGPHCESEVRALKTAMGPIVGGDQKLPHGSSGHIAQSKEH